MSFRISSIGDILRKIVNRTGHVPEGGFAGAVPLLEEPPVDIVPTSYDSLMQRPRVHRLDIFVNPESMPRIHLTRKPASAEYLPLKHRLVNDALKCLKPYISACMALPGLANHPPAQALLETLLRSFLVRYWDMPSSSDNHHAYPWGHCLHSLDVACGEAESASAWTPMNNVGVDEIAKARFGNIMILAAFAKGLVHDGHKIYQYKLQGLRGNIYEYFDPYLKDGTVLDFKLVHPQGLLWEWQSNIRMPGRRNLLEFFEITPKEILKSMGEEINSKIIGEICDMETCSADQESAMRDMHGKRGMETHSIIQNAILSYFKRAPGRALPVDTVFYVNEIWCAVLMPNFFRQLMPIQGIMEIRSLCSYLISQNALASDAVTGEIFGANVEFIVTKNNEIQRHPKSMLTFLRTEYLRQSVPDYVEKLNTIRFCIDDAGDLNAISNDIQHSFFNKWPMASAVKENDSVKDSTKKSQGHSTSPAAASKQIISSSKTSSKQASTTSRLQKKLTGLSCGSRYRVMAAQTTEKELGEGGWLACRQDAAFLRIPEFPRALCGLLGYTAHEADDAFVEHLHEMLLSIGIVLPDTLDAVECLVPGPEKGEWNSVEKQGTYWPLSPSAARQLAVMQLIGDSHAQTP